MSVSFALPSGYGFAVLAASSTFFVNMWHMSVVGKFRKAAQIPYPNAYASVEQAKTDTAAYLFNCAQRAHGNFLEHQTSVVAAILLSGITFPWLAAGLGASWSVFRVLYGLGYTKPEWGANGTGRYKGIAYLLAELGLYGATVVAGWKLLA